MNEAEAAGTILDEIASNQVIMTEVLILRRSQYHPDPPAGSLRRKKRSGDRQSMEYKILRIPRFTAIFVVCMFTVVIGVICLYNQEFSVTRSTLTYFGLPYFIAVFLLPGQDVAQSPFRPEAAEDDAIRI